MPIAEWVRSLTEMETTLAGTLAALDDYERTCGAASVGQAELHEAAPSQLARLEERLGEWDARLAAAAELAASVERELTDRQAAVGRWQDVFDDWRRLIEQPATPAPLTS